jgi:hypothetical protein
MAGIFRVNQLRALDFIGSERRRERTTRNIQELGISAKIVRHVRTSMGKLQAASVDFAPPESSEETRGGALVVAQE